MKLLVLELKFNIWFSFCAIQSYMHGIPSNMDIGKQSISQNPPDRCEN